VSTSVRSWATQVRSLRWHKVMGHSTGLPVGGWHALVHVGGLAVRGLRWQMHLQG